MDDRASSRPGVGTTSENLRTELGELRRRTRADRHEYAFTLLLFGVLVLAAPLVYAPYAFPLFLFGVLILLAPLRYVSGPWLTGWWQPLFATLLAGGVAAVVGNRR